MAQSERERRRQAEARAEWWQQHGWKVYTAVTVTVLIVVGVVVAVKVLTPPPLTDTLQKTPQGAFELIETKFADLTTADMAEIGLKEQEIPWFVAHQIRGFGQKQQYLDVLFEDLRWDAQGNPFMPKLIGHYGQYTAALLRAGVELDQEFDARGKTFTLRQLAESTIRRYGSAEVAADRDDPSWLMEVALHLGRTPRETWQLYSGAEESIEHYRDLIKLRAVQNVQRGGNNPYQGLGCSGMHFLDVQSRIVKRFADAEDEELRELVAGMGRLSDQELDRFMLFQLREQGRQLVDSWLEEYRANPTQVNAGNVRSGFLVLGHVMETLLDERSSLYGKVDEKTLKTAIDQLVKAIFLWHSPEFREAREKADSFRIGKNSPLGLVIRADQLHAAAALRKWLAREKSDDN